MLLLAIKSAFVGCGKANSNKKLIIFILPDGFGAIMADCYGEHKPKDDILTIIQIVAQFVELRKFSLKYIAHNLRAYFYEVSAAMIYCRQQSKIGIQRLLCAYFIVVSSINEQ